MKQKDNFVPQDIAKALKDLGFDVPCLAWWFEEGTVSVPTETRRMWDNWNIYASQKRMSAPLWQQVFEWFRKKYGLLGIVDYDEIDGQFMYYLTDMNEKSTINWSKSYPTYEEAQLKCLKKIIEIIKTR